MYYGKNAFSLGRNQDFEQRIENEVDDIILNPPRKNYSSYKTEKVVLGDSYKYVCIYFSQRFFIFFKIYLL